MVPEIQIKEMEARLIEKLESLAQAFNKRFENMKNVIIDYLTLGNQMAQGSLITALKRV